MRYFQNSLYILLQTFSTMLYFVLYAGNTQWQQQEIREAERKDAERPRVIVMRTNLSASIHHERWTINIYQINVNNSRDEISRRRYLSAIIIAITKRHFLYYNDQ